MFLLRALGNKAAPEPLSVCYNNNLTVLKCIDMHLLVHLTMQITIIFA